VLEDRLAAAVGDGEVQLLVRAELGERHVVDGAGDGGTVDDVDGERARDPLCPAQERLGDGHVRGGRA
jgi:hypothetical protein